MIGPYTANTFDRDALPAVSTGEIVVAGDHVLTGYLDGLGDHETKFKVGDRTWHRTGDAGYLDKVGRLWLLGRASAKLVDEHGIVYPFAVECAAMSAEAVHRCALVEHGGARVLAVELEPGVSEDVASMLQRQLAWARVTGGPRRRCDPDGQAAQRKSRLPGIARAAQAKVSDPSA